jgi:hypothetical protein
MKIIDLVGNKVALVDDADFERISKHKWRVHINRSKDKVVFYAVRTVKGMDGRKRIIYMHREILGLTLHDGVKTDHKDTDGLNNQRDNLRLADDSSNAMNTRKRRGTSKYKGVCFSKVEQSWQSQICKDQHVIFLGYFSTEKLAAVAYNQKAKELFGEFARVNTI